MDIYLSSAFPNVERTYLHLERFAGERVFIWNAADDLDKVELVLHRPSEPGSFFRVPATLLPSGVWRADITPAQLPDFGEGNYEVVGFRGSVQARLGRGRFFASANVPAGGGDAPAPAIPVTTVYDESGAAHTLKVVTLDNGELSVQVL